MAEILPTAPSSPELFGKLLANVSRSFYLTLRVLPRAVRKPISLAYLLARTSDTIADSAGCDAGERLEILRSFGTTLSDARAVPPLHSIIPPMLRDTVTDPAERHLLDHLPILLRLYQEAEMDDRADIRRVLETIIRGQELDLLRFGTLPEGGTPASLETRGELDDYTYRVAGCVGEFWTRLCYRRLPGYSQEEEPLMLRQGVALGKGLQLVNILRDAPEDLRKGRCYLPAADLAAVGLTPATLVHQPEAARPVFEHWTRVARGHFEEAYHYIAAVRPWRLRVACFLPWAIGYKTLSLLEKHPPLETPYRLKVDRREIRSLLWRGMRISLSDSALRRFKEEVT